MRLFDPGMELPDLGLVTVEDAETGEQLFVDASDPAFRKRYAAWPGSTTKRCCRTWPLGADVLELATDDDLLDRLLRFADLRRQRAPHEGAAALSGPPAPRRHPAAEP